MRTGPRPLSVQIGMAASYWPSNLLQHEHFPHKEIPKDIEKMLLGIRLYQNHPFKAEPPQYETVWQDGSASVRAIQGYAAKKSRAAVVLVPSLINKANILDLMPGRSLMQFLNGRGITPYLLDWGTVTADAGQQSVDDIIMKRLVPAIHHVSQHEGRPVHALGYCMGGTLLTGAAIHAQKSLASVTLLAAPWDFHAGSRALLDRVKFWAPSAFPLIEERGVLPVDWIQVVFASLDPFMAARKFSNFADMDQESADAKLFVAVEDWLNDGVDLPSSVAQHCIKEWFFENRPGTGSWLVGGKIVDPAAMSMPALIIASKRDRLVEFDTAALLQQKMQKSTLLSPDSGHIGMIAGREAVEKVWSPLADWILLQPGA